MRHDSGDFAHALAQLEACLATGQWDAALEHARDAGAIADRTGGDLIDIGGHLERLGDYRLAAHYLAKAGRQKWPTHLPEWDGGSLEGRTLLIVQRIRHVGAALRLARLIPQVTSRARRCIILAENRLVPLFRRTFVGTDVFESGPDDEVAHSSADVVASYETLMEHLVSDDESLAAELKPLVADPEHVSLLRQRYATSGEPLVGISWGSTNSRKELPPLTDWAAWGLTKAKSYVSLQYGEATSDIEFLRSSSGCRIIHDESVDSLLDLDAFAAQVAAMDEVLCISNTAAHMAGALGVKATVILDDKAHLTWPAYGNSSGFYPNLRLVRKNRRSWREVFAEASSHPGAAHEAAK